MRRTASEVLRSLEMRVARLEREATYVEYNGKLIDSRAVSRMDNDTWEDFLDQYGREKAKNDFGSWGIDSGSKDQLQVILDHMEKGDRESAEFISKTKPVTESWAKGLEREVKAAGGIVRKITGTREYAIRMIGDDMFGFGRLEKPFIKSRLTLGNQIIRKTMKKLGLVEDEDYGISTMSAIKGVSGMYDMREYRGATHIIMLYPTGAAKLGDSTTPDYQY